LAGVVQSTVSVNSSRKSWSGSFDAGLLRSSSLSRMKRPGAPAGGGSGSGSPGGGGAGAGQRGQNEKEHKANKALRTKANGELVIGDVDAVVPVIGDDQPDQNAADDGAAQAPSRTPTAADRSARQEQRREPRTVSAPEPVRRTAGT